MQYQQKLLDIIKSPYQLDDRTLAVLQKLSDDYPYCQTLQILLAKNLQEKDKLHFEAQVNKASAYAVDRRKFQRYISNRDKPQELIVQEEIKEKVDEPHKEAIIQTQPQSELIATTTPSDKQPQPAKSSPMSLVEIVKRRLREIQERDKASREKNNTTDQAVQEENLPEQVQEKPHEEATVEGREPIAVVGNKPDREPETKPDDGFTESGIKKKKPDINFLIEKFLKEEPRIKVSKELPERQEDLSATSTNEDPQLVSETLAVVFLKQGKKEKALDIYEKLCLKYPEKSSYFAKKILDINNEINI